MSANDDTDLCHDVFTQLLTRLLDRGDAGALSDPERTVILVGRLIEVLDGLEETAHALRRIDADAIAAAFEENRLGRDSALATIRACLAEYIRAHIQTFEVAEELPMAEVVEPEAEPRRRPLPHWARVAFAAHCARLVFPLLSKYWPRIPMERAARIRFAIDSAANSAAQATPQADLNFLVVEMMAMAGAALVGAVGISPPDERSATFASFIAKVAEKAVDAARCAPAKSETPTREAFDFAEQAASESPELARQIKKHQRMLRKAATRGSWTDDTPLSAEELETLLSGGLPRPWWKMW